MKLLAHLTWRSLWQNRKRTFATLFAILLSVAMLVSVSSIAASALDFQKQNEIAVSGSWTTLYENVSGDQIDTITRDADTQAYSIVQGQGYQKLDRTYNVTRPYIYLNAVHPQGFAIQPYRLVEGRYPANAQEILLPRSLAEVPSFSYQIGDRLTTQSGLRLNYDGQPLYQNSSYEKNSESFQPQGTRTYQIVGIYDDSRCSNSLSAGYDVISGLDTIHEEQTYSVYVRNQTLNASLYDTGERLAQQTGASCSYHSYLLLYEGVAGDSGLVLMIRLLVCFISLLIVISSVAVIHNAFAISLSQRSRYLGMLSSVGATRRQKRMTVFFEALFLAIPAIPLGILAGIAGTGLTFRYVNFMLGDTLQGQTFSLRLEPSLLLFAVALAVLTIFISAWLPAKRADQISPIDAIRKTRDLKISTRDVRTSPLIRRVFGMEAELGLKNLKRNRGRYYAVLFSLTLSFVLFVSASAFVSYLQRSMQLVQQEQGFDVALSYATGYDKQDVHVTDPLLALPSAKQVTRMQFSSFLLDNADAVLDETLAALWADMGNGETVSLVSLDDRSLQQLCDYLDLDASTLKQTDTGIVLNRLSDQTSQAQHTYVETAALKEDHQSLQLSALAVQGADEKEIRHTLKIAAYTAKTPLPDNLGTSLYEIPVFVSEDTFARMTAEIPLYYQQQIHYCSDDVGQLETELEQTISQSEAFTLYASYYSLYDQQDEMYILLSIVRLFLYGFIVLISCICVANVFNTISGSMALRAQENAMLLSIGMTKKQFRRMIRFEALFYAIKSIGYGLLIVLPLCFLIYQILGAKFSFAFYLPLVEIAIGIGGLFLLTFIIMTYHLSLTRRESIIETIRRESI